MAHSSNEENSLPGVIKSLHLKNFMCHSNFSQDFHPNLNFITGQNGSGKSAILTGILVALGGKASVTSRTTSLKSLVQKGKPSCRVTITLLNINGLRRYGDEIIIERTITASGSGGYRIQSRGGENESNWRTLKRYELDNIVAGLNIQIDNPVAILNQEVARSFLRSKDPKVKFDLFYKGTLLTKLETTIEETKTELHETKIVLAQRYAYIKTLHSEIAKLRLKCEKIAELDQIKNLLTRLNDEYLWSVVIEEEKVVEEISNTCSRVEKELDILGRKLKETEDALTHLSEESIVQEQNEVRAKHAEIKKEVAQIKAQLTERRNFRVALMTKVKTAAITIKSKESQIDKLNATVERLKAEQDARTREEEQQDEDRKNELELRKSSLDATVKSIKSDADNFHYAGDQERDKLQQLETGARQLRADIESKRRGLVQLSNNKVNKYNVFGPKMEQLMGKIQANSHRFRKKPRGPLGACFTVKHPDYVVLVEGVLWNVLHSFVVDNARDLNLMRQLIDSVYTDAGASQRGGRQHETIPGIIISEFAEQMYNISQQKAAHPSAPTILDLLEFENNDHVVINALIDVQNIERILLFKNNTDASLVLKDESKCPKTLKTAYTLQWFRFTPAPKFAARVMKIKNRAEILRSGRGREKQLAELKLEINGLEDELRDLEPRRKEIQDKERELRSLFEAKTSELDRVRRQLGEATNELKRHVGKIQQKQRNCDLSSYYEELAELREQVEKLVSDRDSCTKELDITAPTVTKLDDKRKQLEKECEELCNHLGGFEEARDKLNARRAEVEGVIRKIRAKLTQHEAKREGLTKEIETKEAILEQKRDAATRNCPERVETERTPAELRKEFEVLKTRIRETEAQLGDVEELQRRLSELKQRYKVYVREFTPINKFYKLLTNITASQHASFERLKIHMGRTLTLFFSAMAKQRGYEGRLLVDVATKELYYFVCPDGNSSSKTLKAIDSQQHCSGTQSAEQIRQNKNFKRALVEYSLGLSGGERSFATICFIMALWQVMECPFYMLDEFDVFMDAFNRKTSQMALIAHAKKFNLNQYILFTPLDLGEVPGSDEACVLRLFPPVRGGGRGNESTQNQGGAHSSDDIATESSPPNRQSNGGGTMDNSVENVDPLSGVRSRRKRRAENTHESQSKIQKRQTQPKVMGVIQ